MEAPAFFYLLDPPPRLLLPRITGRCPTVAYAFLAVARRSHGDKKY